MDATPGLGEPRRSTPARLELASGVELDAPAETKSPKAIPFPVPLDIRSLSLTGLFILALLYTLYFARVFLVPVTLALVLSHLLRPLVRGLKRAGIPESAGAGLVLAAFLGTIALGVFQLVAPPRDGSRKRPIPSRGWEPSWRKSSARCRR